MASSGPFNLRDHFRDQAGSFIGFADGTAASPSVYFGSDAGTGIYRAGTGRLSFATGGTKALEIAADGKVLFGNSTDTNLYRSAANVLKTDDAFFAVGGLTSQGGVYSQRSGAGSVSMFATVSGDTTERFATFADGKHEWGSGSAARDTNLYRSAADTLKTDDSLIVAGNLTIGTTNVSGQWSTWTPTIIQSGTATLTINYARFTKIGRTVHATCTVTVAAGSSSGTVGNSIIMGGLPVTAADVSGITGSFRMFDAGTTNVVGTVVGASTTSLSFYRNGDGNPVGVGSTTYSPSDVFNVFVTYEAAT